MQIPAVSSMIATVEKQLTDETVKLGRLEIIAPVSGTVFPPPVKPHRDSHDGRLPGWSGSPFHEKNRGAVMQEGDQFCQIGDASKFEAVLVIDQSDIDLVGQFYKKNNSYPPVEMKLDAFRWTSSEGQIEKVASAPMEVTPVSLASQGGGELSAKTDPDGMLRPISTSYQARVPLENQDDLLRVGLTGQARVYTGWQPLGRRLYRYLARTFRFDW
jgi:putative peptide zinc metalloprotease protein